MYAIVKTGGKQYRVQTGQRLLVERLAAEAGAEVALEHSVTGAVTSGGSAAQV